MRRRGLTLGAALAAIALLGAVSAGSAAATQCNISDAVDITIGDVQAETMHADDIAATSAELHGSGALGGNTSLGVDLIRYYGYFWWGLDPNIQPGQATPEVDGQLHAIDYGFSADIGPLNPDTTYYFQMVVHGEVKDAVDVHYSRTCHGGIHAFRTLLSPPAPVALAPSVLTAGSATLQGTVNPNGAETTASFTYQPVGGGTQITTPAKDVGSGSSPVQISQPIVGLQASTQYSVQVNAANLNNSAQSAPITFTTLGTSPRVQTGEPTGVTATGATLNGSVDPKNSATDYHFEYGTDTSYGQTTPSQSAGNGNAPVAVSAAISNLVPGQTYHYRLVASSEAGNATGEDASFIATSDAVVQTGGATAVTDSSARLNAQVDPRGLDTQAWFEWGTSALGTSTTPELLDGLEGAVPVSATLTGLEPSTQYRFRGRAVDAIGASYGSARTFTTRARTPAISTGAATAVGGDGATVAGTVNPEGAPTQYWFDYGLSSAYGTSTSPVSAGDGRVSDPVSQPIGGLLPNRTYHYRLSASNDGGTAHGSGATFFTAAPPLATTAAAAEVGTSVATLLGQVDPLGRATKWWFEYGTDTHYGRVTPSVQAGAGIGQQPVSAAVAGLQQSTTYRYRLVAHNADGLLTRGADQSFTTGADPLVLKIPPVATTGRASRRVLTGRVNTNRAATSFYFQYGKTASYGRATGLGALGPAAADVPVRARLGRLRPGRYHYRLVASSVNGTSYGADRALRIKGKKRK